MSRHDRARVVLARGAYTTTGGVGGGADYYSPPVRLAPYASWSLQWSQWAAVGSGTLSVLISAQPWSRLETYDGSTVPPAPLWKVNGLYTFSTNPAAAVDSGFLNVSGHGYQAAVVQLTVGVNMDDFELVWNGCGGA